MYTCNPLHLHPQTHVDVKSALQPSCPEICPQAQVCGCGQGIEGRLYFNQGELQGFTPTRGQAVEGIVGNNSRAQPIARQITPGTQVRPLLGM